MIKVTVFISHRAKSGMSQTELALAAGVSQQLIGEIEKGRTKTTKAIYLIASALGISADTLDPSLPPWDERFSEIVSDLRKLSPEENKAFMAKMKRDLKAKIKVRGPTRERPARETAK